MLGNTIISKGIKKILFRMDLLRIIYDIIVNYRFYKEFAKYGKEAEKLHNKHKGERCFIVATGPSLNKTDLNLIKNEIIFGVNTLYKGLDKFGMNCNYYVISDRTVCDRFSKDILDLDTNLILCYLSARGFLREKSKYKTKKPFVIKGGGSIIRSKTFPKDISKQVYAGGSTVIIICLQLAYYMGFKEVYLIGCDCDYSNEAHFDGKKAGILTENRLKEEQHWERVFSAYRICKKVFEEDGRKIYNSTVGGKLEIFERKNLEKLMEKAYARSMKTMEKRNENLGGKLLP